MAARRVRKEDRLSGSGPIRPCRTAPISANEGKADRPLSRTVAALRPWSAANPKALTERAATSASLRFERPAPFAIIQG